MVRFSVRVAAGSVLVGPLAAAAVIAAGPAEAASCRVVTVQNAGLGIAISPPRTSVPYGGCVQFNDQAFGPPVTITVAGGYQTTLNYGETTSGKGNYAARSPGRHALHASNGPGSASGSITVGPAPTRSPAPSKSPSPAPSSSPQPAPSSSSQSSGPQVARSPHRGHDRPGGLPTPQPPPVAPGVSATPGVVPSVAGSPPGPLQTTTPAPVVVAGPLEPPTGRSLGLPAALAALVLIGVGAAVVRVVMAEPVVDDRRSVGGTA